MVESVYVLCFLTSALVAILLLREYGRSRARLLLWCGLGFAGLALNNVLLIADFMVIRTVDLSLWRAMAALVGLSLLVYGLVWEASQRGEHSDG